VESWLHNNKLGSHCVAMRRILLLLALNSCVKFVAVSPLTPESLAGCYVLDVGEWTRPPERARIPPDTILLDTTLVAEQEWPDRALHVLRPPLGAIDQNAEAGLTDWSFFPPDSVQLRWVGAFSMVRADLQARGEDLVGSVIVLSDQLATPRSNLPVASVRGYRTPCRTSPV
jgi:hypothetical protein